MAGRLKAEADSDDTQHELEATGELMGPRVVARFPGGEIFIATFDKFRWSPSLKHGLTSVPALTGGEGGPGL